jgi:Na+/alanine symporter
VPIADAMYMFSGWLWGPGLMVLLVGTGSYLTARTGLIQFRGLPHGFSILRGTYDRPIWPGGFSPTRPAWGRPPWPHGAALTREPAREGMVAMHGPFIDTPVICTITGLIRDYLGRMEEENGPRER